MTDDDYEILPHQEIEYLRHEVEKLKRNPLGDTQASISLFDGISRLNDNIERLVQIFEGANQEMVEMFKDGQLHEQLNRMRRDNEKIANGIISLSEQIEKMKSSAPSSSGIGENLPSPPSDYPSYPSGDQSDSFGSNPFDDEPAPPAPPSGEIADDEVPSPPR